MSPFSAVLSEKTVGDAGILVLLPPFTPSAKTQQQPAKGHNRVPARHYAERVIFDLKMYAHLRITYGKLAADFIFFCDSIHSVVFEFGRRGIKR